MANSEHTDSDPTFVIDGDSPWFRWRDLPLIILFTPFGVFFGIHVAGFAMLIRRWTKLPYLATMVALYILMTIPLWILNPMDGILFPTIATVVILLATVAPISLGGSEEVLNGSNFEHSAPSHIMLCVAYMALPAIDAAMHANAG